MTTLDSKRLSSAPPSGVSEFILPATDPSVSARLDPYPPTDQGVALPRRGLMGFQLAALLGGLFAVPLAGVLWVLMGAAYRNAVATPTPPRRWGLPRWERGTPLSSRVVAESASQSEVFYEAR